MILPKLNQLKRSLPIIKTVSGIYSLVATVIILVMGAKYLHTPASFALFLFLLLIIAYFPITRMGTRLVVPARILLVVNTLFSAFIVFSVAAGIQKVTDAFFVFLFLPIFLYFLISSADLVIKMVAYIKIRISQKDYEVISISPETEGEVQDETRRRFIKLLAGTGVGALVFFLTGRQKVSAASFGSVPGTGTVGIKDAVGTKIDPAIKSPTDSFGVTNSSDLVYPYYYGFTHYNGLDWYILKMEAAGSYTYASNKNNADTTYSTAWASKESMTYGSYSGAFFDP